MRISGVLKQSFLNPFGNLLAVANIVMVITIGLGIHGLNERFILDINRPAVLTSQLLGGEFTAGLFLFQLVYLQWIFIAGLAKFAAQALYPPQLD